MIQGEVRGVADAFSNPALVYIGANGFHHTRCLVSQIGGENRVDEVLSHTKHDFSAIKSDRLHAKTDLACCRLRHRKLLDFENLRATCLMKTDDSCSFCWFS